MPTLAELTPISHYVGTLDLGGRRREAVVLAFPAWYRREGAWALTRERLRVDNGGVVADEGVHALRVGLDGACSLSHRAQATSFRLRGIVGLDADGTEREAIAVDLSKWKLITDGLDRGCIAWEHPATGARYEVYYFEDGVRDRLVLTDDFRTAIRGKLAARTERFGLAFDCTLPKADQFDTESAIEFCHADGSRQRLKPSWIADPRAAADARDAGWRERWRHRAGRLVQTVPAEALDAAAELRTEVTYQKGVSGYSGCTDTYINSYYPTNNYCTSATWLLDSNGIARALVAFDLPGGLAGATINDAWYDFYQTLWQFAAGTVYGYRTLKPWVGDTTTWVVWHSDKEWGTAGCANASDVGEENSTDGGGYDRRATAIITFTATSDAGWVNNIGKGDGDFIELVQAWVDGTATDTMGILLDTTHTLTHTFASAENTTTAYRPKLTIDYTAGATGPSLSQLMRHSGTWDSTVGHKVLRIGPVVVT